MQLRPFTYAAVLCAAATGARAENAVSKTQGSKSEDMPPVREACVVGKLDGAPLVQLEHRSYAKGASERQLLITATGAWRVTITRDGKQLDRKDGCISTTELAKLEEILARATWTFKLADVRCRGEASGFSVFRYEGYIMATTQLCDGKIFDATTRRALDHVDALARSLVPKS
jgi:hypothetical protein